MAKAAKKDASLVSGLQRCEICQTTLTLYPRDFAPCPHCHRRVCRQCWGAAWATKTFAADACSHLTENDGLAMSAMAGKNRSLQWDWQRIVFALILAALAVGILVLLYYLFA